MGNSRYAGLVHGWVSPALIGRTSHAVTLTAALGLVASGGIALAPAAHAVNPSCDALTVTTPGASSCDVPAGVTQLDITATGAGGGGSDASVSSRGGNGAQVTYRLTVTPGETLTIEVGEGGQKPSSSYDGAGGGGWTAVKRGATVLLVAAGGGGAGSWTAPADGGDAATGGTPDGGDGQTANSNVQAGFGATTGAGGAAGLCTSGCASSTYNGFAGSAGVGGDGGNTLGGGRPIGANEWHRGTAGTQGQNYVATGGSGGAGYYGGGGGAGLGYNAAGGGGAGSSYPASGATYATASNGGAAGSDGGDGSITLAAYTPPPTPPSPGGGGSSTPTTVTISLSTNGGTGTAPALSGDQGTWATVPSASGLSREGFVFAGWNSAPDGSGTTYQPGASIQLNGDNTLYAIWQVAGAGSGSDGSGSGGSGSGSLDPTDGNGQIPASGLPAGGSLLLSDGVSVPLTVKPNASKDPQALVVSAPGLQPPLNMRLSGRGDDSDPLGLTSKQALILQSEPAGTRSTRAKSARVQPVAVSSGDGFMATSSVKFYLLPNTYLGTLNTDAAGAYDGSLPIPAGITPGTYTLQVNGLAPDGSVRSLSIGVTVVTTQAAVRTAKAGANVFFASGSPQLTSAGKAKLKALVGKTGKQVVTVASVGYVQPTAGTGNDQSLSTARARNVAAYVRSLGVKGDYVVRGDGRAKQTGATARRVEVTITYPKK